MEFAVGAKARVTGAAGVELHGEYEIAAAQEGVVTLTAEGRPPIQLRPRHELLRRMYADGKVHEVDAWTVCNVLVDGQHRFASQCEQTAEKVLLVSLDL